MEQFKTTHKLLVQACLSTNKEEQQALVSEWENLVAMDHLDNGSMRLAPLFFHKNQLAGIATKHDKRLKILYKYWWLKTNHILNQVGQVYKVLNDNGIKAVLIKGTAIITRYEKPELRPMADFDLLIKPANVQPALKILRGLGYSANEVSAAMLDLNPASAFEFDHAIDLVHTMTDTKFDLHWQMGSLCSTKFTDDLWLNVTDSHLVPGAIKPALVYEAYFIIIHAITSGGWDNLNWIIDVNLLNLTPRDWDAVRKLAAAEKKEDLFNHACCILLTHGVAAPPSQKTKSPKLPWIISEKSAAAMSRPRLFTLRLLNIFRYAKYLFPYSTVTGKLYNSFRRNSFKRSKAKCYLNMMSVSKPRR